MEEFINAAAHHLEHYNFLVTFELPRLIQNAVFLFADGGEISFCNVNITKATCVEKGRARAILPSECRRKGLTYASTVYATVVQKRADKTTVLNKAAIATLPTMVRSCLCNLVREESYRDPGGYFIINGNERVLVTQEVKAYNMTLLSETKTGTICATMRSMSEETAHSVVVECSVSATKSIEDTLSIALPYISKKVHLRVFFAALGYTPESLKPYLGAAAEKLSQESALRSIGALGTKKRPPIPVTVDELELDEDFEEGEEEEEEEDEEDVESVRDQEHQLAYAEQVIRLEMFPHLGVRASKEQIGNVVEEMVKLLLLRRARRIPLTERDNLMYKRFENSGTLILNLFHICMKHYFGTVKQTSTNLNDLVTKLNVFMSKTLYSNFAKGIWGIQKNAYVRYGVSQLLCRQSLVGTLSHLQRVCIPIGKEGKNIKVRLIDPSHFGYICMYETPEGKTCGIVLNMTVSCRITRRFSINYIRDLLATFFPLAAAGTAIWINHTVKLYAQLSPSEFISTFKRLRADQIIPAHVNLFWDERIEAVHVLCDGGRATRPFYDRAAGKIVWLDSAESQHSRIAMFAGESPAFEYCEIHPCFMYGIAAGCIPFSDHNQSPRNVYEASMIKQAMGVSDYASRYDTTANVMPTVQRSLASTAIARAVGCAELPAGLNCIVAIMTCGSWNAEDSLVFNEAAVQRGMFHSIMYKTVTVDEFRRESNTVRLFRPPEVKNELYNYSLLDDRGIAKVGSYVKKKDVLVSRVRDGQDCSALSDEEGIIESVDVFKNISGYYTAKFMLKVIKIPERGDKFANLCAQKGTVGMILPQVDMPFTPDGISPDVIINPNALPSRMTISMLLEMIMGKRACLAGEFVDATPFSENSTNVAEKIEGALTEFGFARDGNEFMIHGETGEPLRSRIFIGTSYYQKLKHMVSEKIHARPHGTVTTLTRQPPAGRARDGGMRMGEMERDAVLAHGAASFLTSRIFDRSDAFHVQLCNHCQVISNHRSECHLCKNTELIQARLPYASKLLFHQLFACMIGCKFKAGLY